MIIYSSIFLPYIYFDYAMRARLRAYIRSLFLASMGFDKTSDIRQDYAVKTAI